MESYSKTVKGRVISAFTAMKLVIKSVTGTKSAVQQSSFLCELRTEAFY